MEQLTDGDLNKSVLLPRDFVEGFAWIQFTFPQPETINAITMEGVANRDVLAEVHRLPIHEGWKQVMTVLILSLFATSRQELYWNKQFLSPKLQPGILG